MHGIIKIPFWNERECDNDDYDSDIIMDISSEVVQYWKED